MSATSAVNIQGWMSPKELSWLEQRAREMDSIAEIGCWKGRSTHTLLSACPGTVYAIDHWQGSPDELEHSHSEVKRADIFEQFMANVGHFPNLRVMKMSSAEAASQVPEVDMVFIDGCHLYEYVSEDLNLWAPKARKLICGHDVFYKSIDRALRERFGNAWETACDSIWQHRKKP